MARENEVGAVWKKTNDRGEYLSISLDLDALLVLTGGAVGKVDIKAYPIDGAKANANQPDYRLKHYPRDGSGARTPVTTAPTKPKPAAAPLDPDDEIPFAWLLPLVLPLAGLVGTWLV